MISTPVDEKVTEGDQAVIDTTGPSWQLPSADAIASSAIEAALDDTAIRMGLADGQVLECLQRGDRAPRERIRYALAKKVAEALGMLDQSIRSVYLLDYDATPGDMCFGEATPDPRIHLIIWTQRRTHALGALAVAIDRALLHKYRDLVSAPALREVLDAQIVDDADVKERSGYGALLSSIHHRPLPLWEREEGL